MYQSNMSLGEQLRPESFDEICGETATTYYLKSQLHGGDRSVVIHGPSGCGKSLLAGLYAKALLCTVSEKGASRPCGQCKDCSEYDHGIHSNFHRPPLDCSEEEFVEAVNGRARSQRRSDGRVVVLLEDADQFSQRAMSLLRDDVVRPPRKMTYIICVEELGSININFIEQLFPLSVRRPTYQSAMDFLELLSCKGGFSIEDDACEILANNFRSSYRELALVVERHLIDGCVTHQRILDGLVVSPAIAFLKSAMERRPFDQQCDALFDWDETAATKISMIGSLIARLGREDSKDKLRFTAYDQRWGETDKLFREYIARCGLSFLIEAIRIWQPELKVNDSTILLKAAELERYLGSIAKLDQRLDQTIIAWRSDERRVVRARKAAAEQDKPRRAPQDLPTSPHHLKPSEVKRLWECASFMVQRYGTYFRWFLVVHHDRLKQSLGRSQSDTITNLTHQLKARFPDASLHWMYRHRQRNGKPITELVLAANVDRDALAKWVQQNFVAQYVKTESPAEVIQVNCENPENALVGHRKLVRLLCNSLIPDRVGRRMFAVCGINWKDNIDLGPTLTSQRVGVSRTLSQKAQLDASGDLEVVAATQAANLPFDWEMREYQYRRDVEAKKLQWGKEAREAASDGVRRERLITLAARWGEERSIRHEKRPSVVYVHNSKKLQNGDAAPENGE
jgi:hypothetical protein